MFNKQLNCGSKFSGEFLVFGCFSLPESRLRGDDFVSDCAVLYLGFGVGGVVSVLGEHEFTRSLPGNGFFDFLRSALPLAMTIIASTIFSGIARWSEISSTSYGVSGVSFSSGSKNLAGTDPWYSVM